MLSRRSVLSILPAAAACPVAAQPASPRPQPQVPDVVLAALAHGFNLPGWLDDEERARDQAPERATLRLLRSFGFAHVRLPLRPERLSRRFASPAAIGRALDEARLAVDLLLGADYAVMIDLHPGPRHESLLRLDPAAGLSAAGEAWGRLARALSSVEPTRVLLELLNEPPIAAGLWRDHAPALARAVRSEAPRHTIVLGPTGFQRVEALAAMAPLPDPNVVYAIHYYDPMAFTHQGLDWAPADPLSRLAGVPFPSGPGDERIVRLRAELDRAGEAEASRALAEAYAMPWTAARIGAALGLAADWSRRHGRPVIVNEFGVLRHRAAAQDRCAWLRAVRMAAEANGLGWTHWDYADGFGLATRTESGEVPDPATIEALLAPATARARHRG